MNTFDDIAIHSDAVFGINTSTLGRIVKSMGWTFHHIAYRENEKKNHYVFFFLEYYELVLHFQDNISYLWCQKYNERNEYNFHGWQTSIVEDFDQPDPMGNHDQTGPKMEIQFWTPECLCYRNQLDFGVGISLFWDQKECFLDILYQLGHLQFWDTPWTNHNEEDGEI